MIPPRDIIADFIGVHEGALSVRTADNGNWYDAARYRAGKPQARGQGVLVGSKFGVTAYALVAFRERQGTRPAQAQAVRRADIEAITLAKAIEIGVELYFRAPGFDRLVWNRVTASILDKAWGSGPGRAIKLLRPLLGLPAAGTIDDALVAAYAAWIARVGEETAAHLWCDARIAFDRGLGSNEGADDPDRIFVAGWNNRSRSFLPGSPWWRKAGA